MHVFFVLIDSNYRCIGSYEGSSCNKISEVKLDHTNSTHQLVHVNLQFIGEFKEQTKMEEYWKVSLRESR